jgi:hypothetical protein
METGSGWLEAAAIALALLLAISLGGERLGPVPGCAPAPARAARPSSPAHASEAALHEMLTHD